MSLERSYRVLSHAFRLRTDLRDVGARLEDLLAPFEVATADATVTYEVAVETDTTGRRWFTASRDGRLLERVSSAEGLLRSLLWYVNGTAIRSVDTYLALHAAAASWRGVGILLPGPSAAGKTTLVAGLTRAGFDYLTDDAALVDPVTARIHPFPRPLAMSAASIGAIVGLRPGLLEKPPAPAVEYHLPPADLRPGSIGAPCSAAFVVAPRYEPGGPTELEPAARASMVASMARASFNFPLFGGRGLQLLRRVVEPSRCFTLRVGDVDSAVAVVLDLVAGVDRSGPVHGGAAALPELRR